MRIMTESLTYMRIKISIIKKPSVFRKPFFWLLIIRLSTTYTNTPNITDITTVKLFK